MTDLREDLTGAFERRANAAIVEDNLDAILTGTNVVRFSNHDDSPRRGGALLAVAAGAAVLAGAAGLVWATAVRTEPPASSSAPAGPVDTIPTAFPNEVPKPDTFELMTIMTSNDDAVGWEFYDEGEPTSSVERCTQYASSFDGNWTSTADIDEAPSVLYARSFSDSRWDVGVYCSEDGSYLVQVVPADTTLAIIADTATIDTVYSGSDIPGDTVYSGSDVPGDTVYSGSDIPRDTAPLIGTDLTDDPVSGPPATIPAAFPDVVPRPDTFDSMQVMRWDDAPVGWEFYDQGQPTVSVERCTQYAATFGPDWTSAAITDEAASVVYARSFTNAGWTVGIYCIQDGGYLVQVMPTAP